ncbi:ATP phosphoribosyltransferase regulatory subunit [Campylobacter concisus]|uniref:ATP phosphoribosyltransferase regulatory subunit n=1 Tax=Campylobacter concisus TaxID=199 RepID=UPI00039898AF|nr:ATP phosphoribosyltransferase regulatory subunit [Campylobacter concisus]ERJ29519.1 ATP phosphoribosyltransferase regulatory subunit, divergent variant [Campylobacter concisus ATCC 51561]
MSDVNVYEHEIPNGSKLYFAKSAKLKRKIEQKASEILEDEGFSEIVTPFFSYHQHLSVDATNLLRFSDSLNHEISLRADSTVDTVRIVLRRLKANEPRRWFYIQPVFRYPSQEIYQIGAELIGENDILKSINIVAKLFNELEIGACLQLSNMQIPKIICEILNLEIEIFENSWLEKILAQNVPWLSKLALLKDARELDEIVSLVPDKLKEALRNLQSVAKSLEYKNLRIVPLYYSKMRYYDSLFFRFLKDNAILASGGNYEIDGISSSGFAVYTDALIEEKINLRK